MQEPNHNTQEARVLISGGFASFLLYLTGMENPVVVGKDYPRKRILDAFYEWAHLCDFETDDADVNLWRVACQHGCFKKE